MNVEITNLLNGKEAKIDFEMPIEFREEDIKNTDLKNMSECFVKGSIRENEKNNYNISFSLSGTMILEDAISLENVEHKFLIQEENDYEVGNYLKINDNMLDIYEVLWENIVLEIPIRFVKDNKATQLEGSGWSLNKEEEKESELSQLSKFLDMEEENEN